MIEYRRWRSASSTDRQRKAASPPTPVFPYPVQLLRKSALFQKPSAALAVRDAIPQEGQLSRRRINCPVAEAADRANNSSGESSRSSCSQPSPRQIPPGRSRFLRPTNGEPGTVERDVTGRRGRDRNHRMRFSKTLHLSLKDDGPL